jgi:hypothetical protein
MNESIDLRILTYYEWIINYQNEMKRQKLYYYIYNKDPEELLQEHRKMNKILRKARFHDKTNKNFKNP